MFFLILCAYFFCFAWQIFEFSVCLLKVRKTSFMVAFSSSLQLQFSDMTHKQTRAARKKRGTGAEERSV